MSKDVAGKLPCGCRMLEVGEEDGIIWCPLHAAAEKLLEAGTAYIEWYENTDDELGQAASGPYYHMCRAVRQAKDQNRGILPAGAPQQNEDSDG